MRLSEFQVGSIVQHHLGLTRPVFVFSHQPARGSNRWPACQRDAFGLLGDGWEYPDLDQACQLLGIDQRMLTVVPL